MERLFSLFLALVAINTDLLAAEAGMPQLDPTYWASQAFWLILVFSILYISISKFYLPKIKNNLENREKKIEENLNDASKYKELSEVKLNEYKKIIENAKNEISKLHMDSKNSLSREIQIKKEKIEKEISNEILKAQNEIIELKKNSLSSIQLISKEIASNIIENISGVKLNESSIKASVEDLSKKNITKYL